jgi:hypothetical protein
MAEKSERPSVWAELKALGRQGAKDLHNAVIPAFPDSARSQDEPGTPLNPTPQMVTQDLGGSQNYEAFLDSAAARGRGGQEQDRGIER